MGFLNFKKKNVLEISFCSVSFVYSVAWDKGPHLNCLYKLGIFQNLNAFDMWHCVRFKVYNLLIWDIRIVVAVISTSIVLHANQFFLVVGIKF